MLASYQVCVNDIRAHLILSLGQVPKIRRLRRGTECANASGCNERYRKAHFSAYIPIGPTTSAERIHKRHIQIIEVSGIPRSNDKTIDIRNRGDHQILDSR